MILKDATSHLLDCPMYVSAAQTDEFFNRKIDIAAKPMKIFVTIFDCV